MAYYADNSLFPHPVMVLLYVISLLLLLTASKFGKCPPGLPAMMYSQIVLYSRYIFAHIRSHTFKM